MRARLVFLALLLAACATPPGSPAHETADAVVAEQQATVDVLATRVAALETPRTIGGRWFRWIYDATKMTLDEWLTCIGNYPDRPGAYGACQPWPKGQLLYDEFMGHQPWDWGSPEEGTACWDAMRQMGSTLAYLKRGNLYDDSFAQMHFELVDRTACDYQRRK